MGSGLSSSHRRSSASLHQPPASPALVVAADGSLREFAPASSPVSASDVLGAGSNAAGDDGRYYVCSSDTLYFDADVPALGADELLRPGQIYFVLPAAMLGRPLPSADMAALAVRTSEALAARPRTTTRSAGSGRARGGFIIAKARVVPAHHADADEEVNEKLNQRTLGGFETASPSPARIAKGSAVAARLPMRRALSTIMEDAD